MVLALDARTGLVIDVGAIKQSEQLKSQFSEYTGVKPPDILVLSHPDGAQVLSTVTTNKVCIYSLPLIESSFRKKTNLNEHFNKPEIESFSSGLLSSGALESRVAGIDEARRLVVRHVQNHVLTIHRKLNKRKAQLEKLKEDLAACETWQQRHAAVPSAVPSDSPLQTLLDPLAFNSEITTAQENCEAANSSIHACTSLIEPLMNQFSNRNEQSTPANSILETPIPEIRIASTNTVANAAFSVPFLGNQGLAGSEIASMHTTNPGTNPEVTNNDTLTDSSGMNADAGVASDAVPDSGIKDILESSQNTFRQQSVASLLQNSAFQLIPAQSMSFIWTQPSVGFEELKSLPNSSNEYPPAYVSAQNKLADALAIAQILQQRISAVVRPKLAEATRYIRSADTSRAQIARIVDLPFVYGVLLIEQSRRESVYNSLHTALSNEATSQKAWISRYFSPDSELSPLVSMAAERIGLSTLRNVDSKLYSGFVPSNTAKTALDTYLNQLEAANLDDVATDLRNEYLALHNTGPIVDSNRPLSPKTSLRVSQAPRPDLRTSVQASVQESRVKDLEKQLIQARLDNKTHELELVRAEAKGEARAEARLEVVTTNQTERIAQLEQENAAWRSGASEMLNAMGLRMERGLVVRVKGTGTNYTANETVNLLRLNSSSSNLVPQSSTQLSFNRSCSNTPQPNPSISIERYESSSESSLDPSSDQGIKSEVVYSAAIDRFSKVNSLAKSLRLECVSKTRQAAYLQRQVFERICLSGFAKNDLALFFPDVENSAPESLRRSSRHPWVAFGEPNFYLHPRYYSKVKSLGYLIARIDSIEICHDTRREYKVITIS